VLKKILESGYSPDIIVVEVNAQIEQGLFTVAPESVTQVPHIDASVFNSGASPEAFKALGKKHGYAMVYCEYSGVNCFLVRKGLLSYEEMLSIPQFRLRVVPMYACKVPSPRPLQWYEFLSDDLTDVNENDTARMIQQCR